MPHTLQLPSASAPAPPETELRVPAAWDLRVLYAVLFASTCIVTGLIWDISWHMTIGRDTLWSPPHILQQIGASVAGLACGAYVLWLTFAGSAAERARAVRFWGFRGPLGAWVCIWGALTMIASVPFDDWWHNAYGLDVEILSPPHTVLLAGVIGVQLGAMLFALARQNREGGGRRLGLFYAFAAGIILTMAMITGYEEIGYPNEWHGSTFYKVTAAFVPLFLVGVGRASRLRWPATATAATYMGIMLVMMWILQLFPARPGLAPIYNPVTHMVPMAFPALLVVPAIGIDLLMRRVGAPEAAGRGRGREWALAGLVAVAFVALMVAAHWLAAEFLLSPYARNHVFGADQWPYSTRPGPWRYEFWRLDRAPDGSWSPALFARGLGIAVVFAFVAARVGLWWGDWMRRVRR